jgi:heat shock protein HslJ
MIRFVIVAILFMAVALPALANGGKGFRAQGNEPFWSLSMTEGELIFQPLDGVEARLTPIPEPRVEGASEIYEVGSGSDRLTVTIAATPCTDTMSGMPFPKTVTVKRAGTTLSGCGGEPASLLRGTWAVSGIDGKAVIGEAVPLLNFEEDGKINGMASCNRFFGGYSLSGEGLAVGPLGSTKMLCAPDVMAQEAAVLSLLETVAGFAIGPDGQLTLRTSDGRALVAMPSG